MNIAENKKFVIHEQIDNDTLIVSDKKYNGDVRIYVKKDEIDELIELLKQARDGN